MSSTQKLNLIQSLEPDGTIVPNSFHTKPVYTLNYIWTIENYSFHHTNKSALKTPSFCVDDNPKFKWFFILQSSPKTIEEDALGLYLRLHSSSESEEVFVKFKFSILDCERKEHYPFTSRYIHRLTRGGLGTGCRKFIFKNYFSNEILMPNDRLTIYCEAVFSEMKGLIETSEEFNSNPVQLQLYSSLERCLSKDFGDLLENRELSDVTFLVAGKECRAHKLVLAARSPVFAAMFRHNLKENENNVVEISDIDEQVFKEMLHYVYTDKCDDLEELALGLLAAANKYDIDGLKIMCQEVLIGNLNVENAAEVLIHAHLHCAAVLKAKAISFIAANAIEVTNSANWKKYGPSYPQWLLMEIFEVSSRQNVAGLK